jgi:carbamate kinase
MIGYLLALELANRLPDDRPLTTVLTMTEVDRDDPAFEEPTKPIGPLYGAEEAAGLERARGWTFRPDGDHLRRVVPSPVPRVIVEHRQIRLLVESGCVVVCAGGGGIPVARDGGGRLVGVEGVIDKDRASALLARNLDADAFVMATDVAAVSLGFGTDHERPIVAAHPDALLAGHAGEFAVGSMLPKVEAACEFARGTGRPAVIGRLADIEELAAGTAGTRVAVDVDGVQCGPVGRPCEQGGAR